LIPLIAFSIALVDRFEQHLFLNEGGTTMAALLDKRNAKRHGGNGDII